MPRKWELLMIGTKSRVKDGEDIEGTIIQYFTDQRDIQLKKKKADTSSVPLMTKLKSWDDGVNNTP